MKIGADFARGINIASKREPLVRQWFRHPPKALVKVPMKRRRGPPGEDAEQALAETEKYWQFPTLTRSPKFSKSSKPSKVATKENNATFPQIETTERFTRQEAQTDQLDDKPLTT